MLYNCKYIKAGCIRIAAGFWFYLASVILKELAA